jgi:AcrR family transcriptional regulator
LLWASKEGAGRVAVRAGSEYGPSGEGSRNRTHPYAVTVVRYRDQHSRRAQNMNLVSAPRGSDRCRGGAVASPPSTRVRKDAVRNRRRILKAAGELLRDNPQNATIPAIAERAEISAATVYRYFSSVDALLGAYLYEVVVQLRDYSHDCTRTGVALFEDVLAEWGRLLAIYGPGMILLRSHDGFLARLHNGDKNIQTVRDAWERPIRAVLRSKGIDDAHFDHALFLYNMMFDPREVLDLAKDLDSMSEALRKLTAAYFGALTGWASHNR